jgi:hypothetical protein
MSPNLSASEGCGSRCFRVRRRPQSRPRRVVVPHHRSRTVACCAVNRTLSAAEQCTRSCSTTGHTGAPCNDNPVYLVGHATRLRSSSGSFRSSDGLPVCSTLGPAGDPRSLTQDSDRSRSRRRRWRPARRGSCVFPGRPPRPGPSRRQRSHACGRTLQLRVRIGDSQRRRDRRVDDGCNNARPAPVPCSAINT